MCLLLSLLVRVDLFRCSLLPLRSLQSVITCKQLSDSGTTSQQLLLCFIFTFIPFYFVFLFCTNRLWNECSVLFSFSRANPRGEGMRETKKLLSEEDVLKAPCVLNSGRTRIKIAFRNKFDTQKG